MTDRLHRPFYSPPFSGRQPRHVLRYWQSGESALQAMHQAGQQIVLEAVSIWPYQALFPAMRDIWDLQPRLERRQPKKSRTY